MTFPRRTLLALATAAGAMTIPRAKADDVAVIQAPITALDNALIGAMKSGPGTAFAQRAAALAPVLRAAFDLPAILRLSVGPGWAQLPQQQQATLLDVFETFTIASYTANFAAYDGERIEMLAELRPAGTDRIVQTRLIAASGTPTPLDYVMRQEGDLWKAVDVLLDGSISRVAVQRSDFRALLRHGDAAALIDSLQRKIKQLSAGTM